MISGPPDTGTFFRDTRFSRVSFFMPEKLPFYLGHLFWGMRRLTARTAFSKASTSS